MTLKQALWEIVRDESIIITNQNIDWLLDRASKKVTVDAQALKESILERKGVIEENIPSTLKNDEKISEKYFTPSEVRKMTPKEVIANFATTTKKHFTPSEVRKMTPKEVRENYDLIIQSMKYWK